MAVADSPVMRQYKSIKATHGDAIVMFRMGDFYEIFGEDARVAAEILQITLTKRRTANAEDEGIPMCGVPFHAAEGYIGKLLDASYRVALVEQTETPDEARKARGSGALVNREVVRLFTPGTLTEDAYLGQQARYLVAVCGIPLGQTWRYCVGFLDLSGGECGVETTTPEGLPLVLARLPIGEVLTDTASLDVATKALRRGTPVREEDSLFQPQRAVEAIKRAYGVAQVDGLGVKSDLAVQTLGALLAYAELTQVGKLPPLRAPVVAGSRAVMAMDPGTRRNLDLTESSFDGKRADSLLGVIDHTVTGPGGRLLARWLHEPLVDVAAITARQGAVTALVEDAGRRKQVRDLLRGTGDISRCVSRLLLGRGSPRDLAVLRSTGVQLPGLRALLAVPGLLQTQAESLNGLDALTALLARAVRMEEESPLPALTRDGGFMAPGFDAELDSFRELVDHGNEKLAALEAHETATSGLGALKLRYNQVWGYFFEITKAQAEKDAIPGHFIHRQTTTNAHRYTTESLMTLERDLGSAGANALRREMILFEQLVDAVRAASVALLDAAMALATTDALCGLAETAAKRGWVRPTVDDSDAFTIVGGKHPVVAARVAEFMPNDCDLSGGALWLLTGPNMAGKSTFLRQNALLAILAQIGSYVPAVSAHIGVCDAVFSRIGAADNLAAGQSTFMVEMVETAQILNRATSRSLVILDELGRGTATYDGLAIAWACVEDLCQRARCRTLFATHYHELTSLADTLPHVSAHQVAVREWKGEVVFLHQVVPGAATGSFGVQVARLAGVPSAVVSRASSLLESLEKTARGNASKQGVGVAKVADLGLFSVPAAPVATVKKSAVENQIKALDVDGLSPKEALETLYRLQGLVQ